MAQQKKEKEDAAAANAPRVRNYEVEQQLSVEEIRKKEEEADKRSTKIIIIYFHDTIFREMKQKNEGNWDFTWDEESKPGHVVLEVAVNKHLDSSLIDVDVHPNYVSMIIKSKVSSNFFCLNSFLILSISYFA